MTCVARAPRFAALAMPLAVGAVWYHLFGTTTAWATAVPWIASAVVAAAALATAGAALGRGSPRVQVGIAIGLLAIQTAIIATTLAGVRLLDYDLFPDARLAVVVGAALVLAIYGLARGRLWARGLALALGAVGAVSGTLNGVHFWSATTGLDPRYVDWSLQMFTTSWVMWVTALGGALVTVNLAAPGVREAFATRSSDATWASSHRTLRWVRPMVVTAFAATPMLLVYAWLQPIAPQTQTTAVALAAALALGGTLAVRGKVIGSLLLVAAGLGLFAQTAVTALDAPADGLGIVGYYAVFWLPAAACALACGVRVAGPTWRLLRS